MDSSVKFGELVLPTDSILVGNFQSSTQFSIIEVRKPRGGKKPKHGPWLVIAHWIFEQLKAHGDKHVTPAMVIHSCEHKSQPIVQGGLSLDEFLKQKKLKVNVRASHDSVKFRMRAAKNTWKEKEWTKIVIAKWISDWRNPERKAEKNL